MDIKITSITEEIMKVRSARRRTAASTSWARWPRVWAAARGRRFDRAAHHPVHDPKDKIREVIGTGGKVIREITEQTGTKIDIEDDGTIKVRRWTPRPASAPSTGSRASWPSRKSA